MRPRWRARRQEVGLGDILAAVVPEDTRFAEAADGFSRTEETGLACGNTGSNGVQWIRPHCVWAAEQLVLDGHNILKIRRAGGVMARYVENVDIDVDVVCRIFLSSRPG